jgi:hypothetical protein
MEEFFPLLKEMIEDGFFDVPVDGLPGRARRRQLGRMDILAAKWQTLPEDGEALKRSRKNHTTTSGSPSRRYSATPRS